MSNIDHVSVVLLYRINRVSNAFFDEHTYINVSFKDVRYNTINIAIIGLRFVAHSPVKISFDIVEKPTWKKLYTLYYRL